MGSLIPLQAIEPCFADGDPEPRIRDEDLARLLEYGETVTIRKLIRRHEGALAEFGVIATVGITPGQFGGRPGEAYLLNEGQCIRITQESQTPRAGDVKTALTKLFMAWRRGDLVEAAAIGQTLNKILAKLERVDDRLAALEDGKAPPRRNFPKTITEKIWLPVVMIEYGGLDPLALRSPALIVSDARDWVLDGVNKINFCHLDDRNKVGPTDGIPATERTHQHMTLQGRSAYRSQISLWVDRVEDFRKRPAGSGKVVVVDFRQRSLF